tara:strand:+ start:153 stop:377 length:225 start_codon:yes stop_codon:yes gene_type:complete
LKYLKIKYNNNKMPHLKLDHMDIEEKNMLHSVINEYKIQQLEDEKTINQLKKKIKELKEINNMIIEHVYPETTP